MTEQRSFYVEMAFGLTGENATAAVGKFQRGGTIAHDSLEQPAIMTYDASIGGVVVGMTIATEHVTTRDRYTTEGDIAWSLGEALDVAFELLEDFIEDKGIVGVRVSPPHRVQVVHSDGLLDAMRTGAPGLESKRQTRDEGEGAAA